MDELISRQAAIDAISRISDHGNSDRANALGLAESSIKSLPIAEPRKGRWIEHNPHKWGLGIVFECSECGEEVNCETCNYCPNCGAKMEESE